MNSNLDLEKKWLTLRVAGDLISTNAEALRGEIDELLKAESPAGWNTFRLDLTTAQMVDSVGLNLVVNLLKRVQKREARMQVLYGHQNVLRTFIFTRLDKQVELVKS